MGQAQFQGSAAVATAPAPAKESLARALFSGTCALGVATVIERGLGFLANLGAARLGGPQLFGAYSVALTTANNVASYAGAGIGTTANRFSGEYPYGMPGYRALLRALSFVSVSSAALAVIILWFAAAPLAKYVLRNPGLTPLLHVAALSAGALILLECLRGLLVGQRRFKALLCLCVLSGGGLLLILPLAARRGALAMVGGQAAVAVVAILVCVILARTLGFAPSGAGSEGNGPRPMGIARFGAVQLAGMIGINAAGWWIASLVARNDVSLVQMGCYSVATQLRNICAMPPLLISQTGYALMTEEGGLDYGGPGRVTVLCTVAATIVSLLISGVAAALAPWVVKHIYGKAFAGAELAATLAMATGLAHMSAAPAAARLTVVSLKMTGVINGIWTLVIVGIGTWLAPLAGASGATATFLAAHLLSAALVLGALLWSGAVPRALAIVSAPAVVGSVALAGLGWLRSTSPSNSTVIGAAMVAMTFSLVGLSWRLGRESNGVAQQITVSELLSRVRAQVLP
jgi:O-antigen/teichoic acid export membrane protein